MKHQALPRTLSFHSCQLHQGRMSDSQAMRPLGRARWWCAAAASACGASAPIQVILIEHSLDSFPLHRMTQFFHEQLKLRDIEAPCTAARPLSMSRHQLSLPPEQQCTSCMAQLTCVLNIDGTESCLVVAQCATPGCVWAYMCEDAIARDLSLELTLQTKGRNMVAHQGTILRSNRQRGLSAWITTAARHSRHTHMVVVASSCT